MLQYILGNSHLLIFRNLLPRFKDTRSFRLGMYLIHISSQVFLDIFPVDDIGLMVVCRLTRNVSYSRYNLRVTNGDDNRRDSRSTRTHSSSSTTTRACVRGRDGRTDEVSTRVTQ